MGQGSEVRRRLRNKKKVALVCAGGGVTGAIYEIGCLRALSDLLDRSVCDLDIYVGVSGGAFVTSLLAAGISPEEMYEQVAERGRRPFGGSASDLYRLGLGDLLKRSARAPRVLVDAVTTALSGEGRNLSDFALSLLELLPAGLLDNSGIREYIAGVYKARGVPDSFTALRRDLYLVAVDLDNGEAVAFGAPGSPQVSISRAVQASTALPGLYRPVRIGTRDYVDGGVKKTAHIHLAIDHGADLVICINPVVPLENNTVRGPLGGHLANKGVTYVLDQVLRIMLHGRMQYGMERYAHEHPEVDILLLEPHRNDVRMFSYNIMRYSARRVVAEHGYRSVREGFDRHHREYARRLARHRIRLVPPGSLPELPAKARFRAPVARSLAGSLDSLSAKLG
ncbi:MAG TPA: patatin-like phospholipase family protein [Vicinamibacteria bacterium]|nr:patatin-like phospholipase family protein [Vicinamibacteria bacterium]